MKDYDEKMIPILIEKMKKDPELGGFTENELKTILLKIKIFQLGLLVMVANGLMFKDYKKKDLEAILSSTANDIIASARINKGRLK